MSEEPLTDYYEDLQVSPNADQETIERVFRLLAKRYHPDNQETGSVEKFDAVSKAFHKLSDPVKRAAYDNGYEQIVSRKWKLLAPASSPSRNGKDREIRNAILSILYVERRNSPTDGAVGMWRLEKLLGWPEPVLEFQVWYLKEKGLVRRTDSGGYAITADGVDVIEESGILLNRELLLPEQSVVPENGGSGAPDNDEEKPAQRRAITDRI